MDDYTQNRIEQQMAAIQEACLEFLAMLGEHVDAECETVLELDGTAYEMVIRPRRERSGQGGDYILQVG